MGVEARLLLTDEEVQAWPGRWTVRGLSVCVLCVCVYMYMCKWDV